MHLYGASGHGKVAAEIAIDNQIDIQAFIDDDPAIKECLGYPVLKSVPSDIEKIFISIGNNKIRKKVSGLFSQDQFLTLLHPKSIISGSSELGSGTVVMGGATINASCKIGMHCIINTNASVDHDCTLEDFVHISPNAALAGNVSVGEGTHIGIGVSVIPGIKIGKWCIIGAGSVIINDIPDGCTVIGNPGKISKQENL